MEFLRKLFSPPVFTDEDKTRVARYLNAISLSASVALLIVLAIRIADGSILTRPIVDIVLTALLSLLLITRYLMFKGYVRIAGQTLVGLSWLGLLFIAWGADGLHDSTFIALLIPILVAGLLLGTRAMIVYTAASILAAIGLAYFEAIGIIQVELDTPGNFARDVAFIFALIGLFIYLVTSSLNNTLLRARQSAREYQVSNDELQNLRSELEMRVEERTTALEEANIRTNRRAAQLEAIAHVAQEIGNVRERETLFSLVTKTISEHFGFYHVGIFLIDENREFAVLRAANSEGGQKMLERNHKLRVGSQGIVGYVANQGRPRIALDVGDDAAFFDNPDLPATRSEMGLPLQTADRIIGVLDVQSTAPNAFSSEDISTLNTLAAQVSIAIENTRLHAEVQEALEEAEKVIGQRLQDAWSVTSASQEKFGYLFSDDILSPITEADDSPGAMRDIQDKVVTIDQQNTNILAIPIKLRDQVVGVIEVRLPDKRDWDADEVDIIRAAADRAALAIETATLLDETTHRAEIERATAEISDKLSSSSRFNAIVRTAAEELSKALGGSEVLVQLQPDAHEEGNK